MNAFEELRAWINRDRPARSAHLDTVGDDTTADPQAVSPAAFAGWHPRVELHFEDADGSEHEVQGIGTTFDDALIAALDALPAEVRR